MIVFVLMLAVVVMAGTLGYMSARRHDRKNHIRTVETIEDTEGNLSYKIQLGRERTRRSPWYWRVSITRDGVSTITGTHTMPGGVEIQVDGLPDGHSVEFGGDCMGGPCRTRNDALASALHAVEEMR